MGDGYDVRCKECGYGLEAYLGAGFSFFRKYPEIVADMKSGKYGEAASTFFEEHPDGAVDIKNVVAICDACDRLEVVPALSTWILKQDADEGEAYLHIGNGGDCKIPTWNMEAYFDKIADHEHLCESCRSRMRIMDAETFGQALFEGQVHCPKCHGIMEAESIFNWD